MSALTVERSAAAGSFILVLRFATTSVLNYGFGIVLAWILVPAEFGTVSVLQSVLLVCALALTGGFPWVLARATAGQDDNASGHTMGGTFRTALVGNVALGLGFTVLIVAARAVGLPVVPSGSWLLVGIVAATCPVLAVNAVLSGVLEGTRRFGGLGAVQSWEVFTKCIAGIVFVAVFHLGAAGVALGFLLGAIASAGAAYLAARDRLPGWGRLGDKSVFRLAVPIFVATTGLGVLVTVDVLALPLFGGEGMVAAGIVAGYQVAVILARAPFYVAEAVINAVFPFMVRGHARREAHVWFATAFRWIVLAIVPAAVVLVIAPGPILGMFFPKGYADETTLVRLLTLSTVGLILTGMYVSALFAVEQGTAIGRRMPLAVLVDIAAMAVLIPRYGAIGAALASAVGAWSAAVLLMLVYHRIEPTTVPSPLLLARYALAVLALLPALLLAQAVPHLYGVALIAVALMSYVFVGWAAGLFTETEVTRVRTLATRLRRAVRRSDPAPKTRPSGVWRRRAIAGGCGAVAVAAQLWNLRRSPDTQYDEVVYVRAALNVAKSWNLTWDGEPFFVHPPFSFLAQAGWLRLLGLTSAAMPDAITAARILSASVGAVNVAMLALLVYKLTSAAKPWHRTTLIAIVAVVAALDPILLRYSRLAIIEPFALLGCLIVLNLSWRLRNASAGRYVAVLGPVIGITLLTKEIAVFLLVVPLLFALLQRPWRWRRVGRDLGAFGVGLAFWSLFPLWADQLGFMRFFLDVKFATVQRLFGALQITGWNRPGVSLADALQRSAGQYLATYVFLLFGGLALLAFFFRRHSSAGTFVFAWLLCSYAFCAYCVAFGTLNEQFFVYIVPAAVAGTVLAADIALAAYGRRVRRRGGSRAHGYVVATAMAMVVLIVGASSASWATQYGTTNDGVYQVTRFVAGNLPGCATVNTSGDPDKFGYLLAGHRLTTFASGPGAISHGVHYFLLSDKDIVSGYSAMTPEGAAWIRSNGRLLATFASRTYDGVELWHVSSGQYDPLADVEDTGDGQLVHTTVAHCGVLPVTNGPDGLFFDGYSELGGKAMVGYPTSQPWSADGKAIQAFAGAVLSGQLGIGEVAGVDALPLTADLADRAPDVYRRRGFPPVTFPPGPTEPTNDTVLSRLTDPAISKAYLGTDLAAATPAALTHARQVFGDPISEAQRSTDGHVRQAFTNVVMERAESPTAPVHLADIATAAIEAGLVKPPASAITLDEQPSTEPPTQLRPTNVEPFATWLGIALSGYTGVALLTLLPRRRRRNSRRHIEGEEQ